MVQHKPEVCFLLPHEVQTEGTSFAAGFPTFPTGLCRKINSPPQKRMRLCKLMGTPVRTHGPPGTP